MVLHSLVLAPCLALPVALPNSAVSLFGGGSYLWLVVVLAMAVGLPFIGIAANAPLLQSWFVRTAHRDAHEPYFLYRASNAGSLVALIGYPVLFEPMLALPAQATMWSVGFVLLALMIALCGAFMLAVWRGPTPTHSNSPELTRPGAGPIGWEHRLAWTGLAFVPSGLLVAFTTYLTTDIASAPLLWVVPLAIYLVTFIIVFRPSHLPGERFLVTVQPFVVAVAILVQSDLGGMVGLAAGSAIGLVAFVTTCLVCHRRLYLQRPVAAHLTEFYLWMSLGGVLGGVFAAIVAPQIFFHPQRISPAAGPWPCLAIARAQGSNEATGRLAAIGLSAVAAVALGVAVAWGGDLSFQVWLIALSIAAAVVVGTLAEVSIVGLQLALVTLTTVLVTAAFGQRSDYSAAQLLWCAPGGHIGRFPTAVSRHHITRGAAHPHAGGFAA